MTLDRADGIRLEVTPLSGGVVRIRAGGLDGFQDSLLNRYAFIESPPLEAEARWKGRTLHLPDGYDLIVADDLGFTLSKHDRTLMGTCEGSLPATAPTVHRNQGYRLVTTLGKDEKLIGFGDQYRRGFLLNGQKESLWIRNQSDYIPVPFFMSSHGYGMLFNTTRRLFYDFGIDSPDRNAFRVEKDCLDVYLILGDDYEAIIDRYTRLTGRPSLPPMFTFGLWMVAHTEIRAHELLQLALEMRRAEIPCDLLALEPLWMEKLYDESLEKNWSEERFPFFPWVDARDSFIGSLKDMGYHFGLWMLSNYDHTWEEERAVARRCGGAAATQPVLHDETGILTREQIETAEQDDHFGHHPMYLDRVTKPEEPYYEHLKKFVDQGVDYFKQDGFAQINLHPDRLYGNGRHDDEMHNIHYMIYSRQMVSGFEAHTGRRGFGLMCAGWAGFQRFSGTWTGDTGGGAQPLCGILQLATVGHAIATCDVDVKDSASIHMGFLLPWTQVNSWSYYKYPVYKGEASKAMFADYARLRMRLLPFYYSLARQATLTGRAIARPMHLLHPDREEAYHLLNQFMIGDALLVGAFTKAVSLPTGRWLDFWTGEAVEGDWTSRTFETPPNRGGQLFMKAGAIIPMFPVQQFVGETPVREVTWRIFPSPGEHAFTLYLDNGTDFAYREGGFAAATLSCWMDGTRIALAWSVVEGSEPERIAALGHVIELIGAPPVTAVSREGRPVDFTEDPADGICRIGPVRWGDPLRIVCAALSTARET